MGLHHGYFSASFAYSFAAGAEMDLSYYPDFVGSKA
jgi:hypothetical protein